MKKILVILLLAISSQAGGIWSMLKNADINKNIKPISTYTIEVSGVNVRAYTFIPDKMPDTKCVMVFTEDFFSNVLYR